MILDWTNIPEQAMPNFKGGEGVTYARMFFDGKNRIMLGRLPAGSIGSVGSIVRNTLVNSPMVSGENTIARPFTPSDTAS